MLEVLNKRLSSPETHQGDILDHIIKDMKVENFLTEEFAVQLMFGLLFVSFDSLSATLTLAFKLLAENPTVLEDLTVCTLYYQQTLSTKFTIILHVFPFM